MTIRATNQARVIPLRPFPAPPGPPPAREPLWRDLVGDVLRGERLAQERTLKDVADTARISMAYLSEVERGRKEASSEVLAAAAQALGLSLSEVLALAQGELIRLFGARSRSLGAGGAGHAGRPGVPGPGSVGTVQLAA
ncbi:helix-turn-helix domain-containing protein [Streptomyces luridiscabiei]|uniref:helix-turn-helix domain-containing protein n=1 Tax=Streptomyces luridiscabiei TaxID=164114 RepID=UPI0006E297D7|nr:helix-turn-helix domain-containing protein [Streptomyces luridiscabiei]